jgi:gas vesicle protein
VSLPGVSVTLDADVEGFVRGWDRAADAAERAAARIRAASAAANEGAPDTSRWREFEQELQRLTQTVRGASDHLREFGNHSRKSGDDVDHLGKRAKEAAEAIGSSGGSGGGLSGALGMAGKNGQLMAAGIAVVASVLPAVVAAALAAGAAMQALGVVAAVVIGGWHGIEQAGKQLSNTLGGLQKQLDSVFRSGLSQEFTQLGHAISSLDGPLKGIAHSVVDVVKSFTGWIRSAQGMSEIRQMLGGVDNMVKQLAPGAKAVAQAFTAWGAAAAPVLGEIGKAISSVFEKLNQVIQKAKETGQLQKAFEAGAKAISAFGDVLAGIVQILIQVAADAGMPASEAIKKFGEALKDAAPLIGLVFKELALAINIIMTVVAWFAKLAAALAPLYEGFGKVIDKINEFVNALSPDKIAETAKAVGGFFAGLAKTVGDGVSAAVKAVEKWWDDTKKAVQKGIDDAVKAVKKWADDFHKDPEKAGRDFVKMVQKWWDDTVKAFKKGIDDTIKGIKKWASDIKDEIDKFVKGFIDTVNKWWDDAVKAIQDGIKNAIDEIKQIPQKAKDALSKWVSDMKQIGKDAIDGIAEGIKSAVANLVQAATDAAKAAMGAIKQTLGIASPSVVLRNEVGLMMGAGMSEGILASAGLVSDAMRRTAAGALAAGRGQAGMSATGMARSTGGQTITLTVSGGADTAVGTMIARLAQQGKLKITANAVVR